MSSEAPTLASLKEPLQIDGVNGHCTSCEQLATVVKSLIVRMEKQDHEFETKMKAMEAMVVAAQEQAFHAEQMAQLALKNTKDHNASSFCGKDMDASLSGNPNVSDRRKSSGHWSISGKLRTPSVSPGSNATMSRADTGRKSLTTTSLIPPLQTPSVSPGSNATMSRADTGRNSITTKSPVPPPPPGGYSAGATSASLARKRSVCKTTIVTESPKSLTRKESLKPPAKTNVVNRQYGRIEKKEKGTLLKPKSMTKPAGQRKIDMSAGGKDPVMVALRKIFMTDERIQFLVESGTASAADLKEMEQLEKDGEIQKLEAAKLLLKGFSSALTEDSKTEIIELCETLVNAGDHVIGNSQLVGAMIHQISTIDWAKVISDLNLAPICAFDGSLKFLDMMLSVPGVKVDTVEMIEACFFNQTCRIPSSLVLLKHDAALNIEEYEDDIGAVWQEFFEDIASEARAIPKENRAGRVELMLAMLDHPTFKMDYKTEGPELQTSFTRACAEGDLELVKLMLHRKLIDVNRVQSDTTTALTQAVTYNRVSTVDYLLRGVKVLDCLGTSNGGTIQVIEVNHVSDNGSALYISKNKPESGHNNAIASMLEGYGGESLPGKVKLAALEAEVSLKPEGN